MEQSLGILVVAALAVLFVILSGVRKKRIEPYLDAFAHAFCELSDHVLGDSRGTAAQLSTEHSEGGALHARPAEFQPEAIREILSRGADAYALQRIQTMYESRGKAQEHLANFNLIGKKINGVLNRVYDLANLSLSIINDPDLLTTQQDLDDFQFFLQKQTYLRNTTLASIVSEECRRAIAA